jgi:hypothetical protein
MEKEFVSIPNHGLLVHTICHEERKKSSENEKKGGSSALLVDGGWKPI